MLRSPKNLENYTLTATDGDIGTAMNFLLDDEHWSACCLVCSTSGLLDGRHELVSPASIREIEWGLSGSHLVLTNANVKDSPNVNAKKLVSLLHEREYYRQYGYAPYWGYSGLWGMDAHPGLLAAERWRETPVGSPAWLGGIHWRSASALRGYHVQGIFGISWNEMGTPRFQRVVSSDKIVEVDYAPP
jgi:hypothetical protein